MQLATRATTAEIIDGESYTPAELAGSLADLERYNRHAGGAAAIRRAVREIAAGAAQAEGLYLLDVGAGGGDIAADLHGYWSSRRSGLRTLVVAADRKEAVLACARQEGERGGVVRLLGADAASLPLADASFDVAWSSLVLHHLSDASIVAALSEMKRVTRLGFAVSDLRRSLPALASVWILTRLTTRNRLTLHDAPLSVRRALRPAELVFLARKAGLGPRTRAQGEGFVIRRRGLARLVLLYRHDGNGRRR